MAGYREESLRWKFSTVSSLAHLDTDYTTATPSAAMVLLSVAPAELLSSSRWADKCAGLSESLTHGKGSHVALVCACMYCSECQKQFIIG